MGEIRSSQMGFKNVKGFTLLELLTATAILTFAISGLLLLFVNCAVLDDANRNKSIALSHAETALEYVKSQSFSTIQNHLISAEDGGLLSWDLGPILNLTGLTGESISVTTAPDFVPGDPLDWIELVVNVSWLDNIQARSLSLGTSISR